MIGRKQASNRPGKYRISAGKSSGTARSAHSTKTRKTKEMDLVTAREREEARKALEARRRRKEQNIREQKEAAANRVSYVRKPLAKRSFYSLGFLVIAIALGAYGIYGGVTTNGQAALNSAAFGFSSILFAAVALWYGIISFLEEEKKYIIARITVALSGLVLAGWAVTIIMGIRG